MQVVDFCPRCRSVKCSCAFPPYYCNANTRYYVYVPNNKGWECPKCGNVYAPEVWECPNCNSKGKKKGE